MASARSRCRWCSLPTAASRIVIPGGLGVTIFFVLSGYLITTLMRIEHARSGRIGYRGFYLRRLLRLMPPLFIVVAAAGVLAAAVHHRWRLHGGRPARRPVLLRQLLRDRA